MARYLAAIEGGRGEATRLGTPKSGIRAQAQGWDVGVTVYGNPKPLDEGNDYFIVYATSGSRGSWSPKRIGEVQQTSDGRVIFTLDDAIAAKLDPKYQTAELA